MSEEVRVNLPGPGATPTRLLARTLTLVAAVCGAVIVAAYHATFTAIQENQRVVLERAVLGVVPGSNRMQPFALGADGARTGADLRAGEVRVFGAYDAAGKLRGIALEGIARGYADVVQLLYGYDPACQCIVGMRVVQMRETPGIGDKVRSDASFLENFRGLEARVTKSGEALAHAITTVRHGAKSEPWQIDAISGATVTSRAVGRAVNDSAQTAIPRLLRYRRAFEESP
ncbi:MAG: FMN-binding protein [Gammaproteobacteria bacterium]|nr:FMN-binding protein [Gammaproteobacteria bacterium]